MNFQQWINDMDAYRVGTQPQGVTFDARRSMLEALLGAQLPPVYADFVRVCGGFAIPGDSQNDDLTHKVSVFFGFLPGDAYDLAENLSAFGEYIPEKHLPFAGDGGGSAFLLDARSGKVAFFEHETGELTPLAPDLETFLRSLEE